MNLNVKKLKTELEEAHKACKKSEKMLNDLRKEHEEKHQQREKEMKLKQEADLHKKEIEIKEVRTTQPVTFISSLLVHCSSKRS